MPKRKYESVRGVYGSKEFERFEDKIMTIKAKTKELNLKHLNPFAANSEFWFPSKINPLIPWTNYSRDGILDQNPMAKELILINQHVITVDSQQAEVSHGTGYTLLQRWYCELFCKTSVQAKKLAKAMKKYCYVVLFLPGSPPRVVGDQDRIIPVTIGVYSKKKVEEYTSHKGLDFGKESIIEEAQFQNSLLAGKIYPKKQYPLIWLAARKYPKPKSMKRIPTSYTARGQTVQIPLSSRHEKEENKFMWNRLLNAVQ